MLLSGDYVPAQALDGGGFRVVLTCPVRLQPRICLSVSYGL